MRSTLGVSTLLAALSLAACGPSGGAASDGGAAVDLAISGPSCETGEVEDVVLVTTRFVRQEPLGVSAGFDLDGHTAAARDPRTCGHASLVGEDGASGIDNQASLLIPLLDDQAGNSLDGLILDAINQGTLLVGITLKNMSDRGDDPCVDVEVRRLVGKPEIGTDRLINPSQTFATDRVTPVSAGRGRLGGGVLEAGPFELSLPVQILEASFDLVLHDARLRIAFSPDGAIQGLIGGAVDTGQITEELRKRGIGDALRALLPILIGDLADLDQDPETGRCGRISTVLAFDARPGFIDP